jgi:hypothetical protein
LDVSAEVQWHAREHLLERDEKLDRDLEVAVVASPVIEPTHALPEKARLRSRHMGDRDVEQPCHRHDSSAFGEQRNDTESLPRQRISALSAFAQQSPALGARHSGYLRFHGASLDVEL